MPLTNILLARGLAALLLVAGPAVFSLSACATKNEDPASSTSELRKRFPTPLDLANARADCLNERGWGATVTDRGEIAARYPSNKQSEYEMDNLECLRSLGVDPDAPTPEAVVESSYLIYKAGAACLEAAGWPVSPVPSLQTFKDTYETNPWFPWTEVPVDSMAEALEKCPGPEPMY